MKIINILIFILIIPFLNSCTTGTLKSRESNWSVKMAEAVMHRNDSLIRYNNPPKVKWQYDIAMLGQAIDKLGYKDQRYSRYMEEFYDYFIDEAGNIRIYKQQDFNLDNVNPAKGLITLYKRTGEDKYLQAIETIMEQLEGQPRTEEGGFWHKKIYPSQMWLDGIYMATPFMAQYAKEFGQSCWFDTVAQQIELIYKNTLDSSTGLLYHAHDASREQRWADPETGRSRQFWGRAMGWYMMALVDVLDYFPEDHPRKEALVTILNQVSEALMKVRDPEAKLWYQVLDQGGRAGNYLEASSSTMFIYTFAKGAKKGFLPEVYHQYAKESFEAALKNFIKTGSDNHLVLTNTCGAAGLGGKPYRDGTYEYYINEKVVENDPKGVAPFILAALELNL
jgi:unsaturated rhamnogalacturonyl hydrolase